MYVKFFCSLVSLVALRYKVTHITFSSQVNCLFSLAACKCFCFSSQVFFNSTVIFLSPNTSLFILLRVYLDLPIWYISTILENPQAFYLHILPPCSLLNSLPLQHPSGVVLDLLVDIFHVFDRSYICIFVSVLYILKNFFEIISQSSNFPFC